VRANAEQSQSAPNIPASKKSVIVTRICGDDSIAEAYAMLQQGADTLDAALHVCQGREDDPNDHTVGLGGLPNEEGVVELDSCLMHGPTRGAGSVGGVRNIKNVCRVARKVMDRTSHVMLCGEGAERFAVAEGFPRQDMLTEEARKIWLVWKETRHYSWWGPGMGAPGWKPPTPPAKLEPSPGDRPALLLFPRIPAREDHAQIMATAKMVYGLTADFGIAPERRWQAVKYVMFPPTGTIHVSACNAKGEISGATTTSGLAWKIPGRLGDSPIIGAGCYTDGDVGSAGATGAGEENIKVAGAHTIVECMRRGMSPEEAGMEALRRVARIYDNDMAKLRYIEMEYYILRRDGAYASVCLWDLNTAGKRRHYVVHDGTQRTLPMTALYQGTPLDWPPQ
jgi:N4-(beta-N-acetylglucosaminyl)-L-asparaginase